MFFFALPAALVVISISLLVIEAWRAVPRRYVNRFLSRYPIQMTTDNGPMVLRRLARVRAARTLGGLSGALAWGVAGVLGWQVNVLLAVVVGYLFGAIVAELPARRDRVVTHRPTATLVPRRLRDYAPGWIVIAPIAVVALTLAINIAVALGSQRTNLGYTMAGRGVASICAIVLSSLVTLAATRIILYRPQPYTTTEMVTADDALRAAALHCVCGGGFALVAIIASGSIASAGVISDIQVVRWIAPWLGFALMPIAMFAWLGPRIAPWLVRRPYETMLGQPQ